MQKDNLNSTTENQANDASLMDMTGIDTVPSEKTATNQTDFEKATEGLEREKNNATQRTLYPFRYKANTQSGRKVKGIFDAESIDECKHILEIQGFTDIVVEPKKAWDIEINLTTKIS